MFQISTACPESVRLNAELILGDAIELRSLTVEGALLEVTLEGDTLDACLAELNEVDSFLRGKIADADDEFERATLSELKATVLGLESQVRHHAFNTVAQQDDDASGSEKATDSIVESHLQGEQHTSSEGSSEQHGAVSDNLNEENVNVEAQQEGSEQPRKRR